MTTTLALHRFEGTTNIGDIVCSPCQYFDYEATYFDAKRLTKEPLPEADLYICGGGAITTKIRQLPTYKPKVAWGIGQSLKHPTRSATTIPLEEFELVGTRDIGVEGTEWVPCASCMSPLFDEEYEVEHVMVSYMNSQKYSNPDMPYLTNRVSFEEAIKFIGSAEIVYTNSYHGAYWATLLGRAAVICDPYSSKFVQYKHQPAMQNEKPVLYPEALAECRETNIEFDRKVRSVVS